jgi:hypothetical protein
MHGLTQHRPSLIPGSIGHVARHPSKAEIAASKETQCRK